MNTLYGAGSHMPSAAGPNGSLINGGIPQLANRSLIKSATTALLSSALPDRSFSGFAVFDIEYPGLYPLWDYDFGPDDQRIRKLAANWTASANPQLTGAALTNRTMADFNAGMKDLWKLQLQTATDLYPGGRFGYYRMPHCWYSALHPFLPCNGSPKFGDELAWLWQSEGGIFPGAYFSGGSNSANNSARMISVVREAVRVAQVHGHGRPAVLPFVSYAYRGGQLDHQIIESKMMWKMLQIPASLGTDGVVIWGGSGDAKTVQCDALSTQLDLIGPKLKALRAELTQCASSTCSGHGRCALWFKPTRCVCDADRTGEKCQHQSANLKTDDRSPTVFAPRELCIQLPPLADSQRGRAAAEDLLLSELRRRHRMHLPRDADQWSLATDCPPNTPTISLGVAGSGPVVGIGMGDNSESFVLRRAAHSDHLRVVGRSDRGLMHGVGRLLRELTVSASGALSLSSGELNLSIEPPPFGQIRGHQLTDWGFYMTTPAFEQFVKDLIVFGTNQVEL
jgi:hypothetical protein